MLGSSLSPLFCVLQLLGLALLILGNGGNQWSFQVPKEVMGEVGKSATLPCWFSSPHSRSHDGALIAIWRISRPYDGTVVFKCVTHNSSEPCRATTNYMNKFTLLGNPRHNNLSISIGNLTWEDSTKYYCRVELSTDRHDKYETKTGIKLHLAAPPRILNMTIGFDSSRGYYAVCLAEGEPAPSLYWTDPLNKDQDISLTRPILKHQVATELHYLTRDGKYTCVATNCHGRVESSVYFFKFKSGGNNNMPLGLLWAALALKLMLLLVLLCAAVCYRNGKWWDF
ncbi:sialic acid-binding Ig-like lectin 15 [Xenopus laevis]|uniref:Sialic acid-binding Ig-like lectin 15 n=1 Tax=Xenopus laevis TaxID=8355 RepID=A0A8J0U6B0_XENLA|nr:sialic acid-binding Ig-like lectin 15 [Xenopus laevis]